VRFNNVIAAATLSAASTLAVAQAPTGPVRISSTLPAGSGPDAVTRMVAEKLQARWGQPVLVDPKPGGAGVVAINAVKNLPPTGNDLVVVDVGNLSINPLIFQKLAYDPQKDLVPVALLYKTAFFIAVAADGPYKSLKDLLAASGNKAAPLRYGSNAVGGPIHLASARLEDALGVEMVHVPYKETTQLYTGVSTGETQWSFGSIATTLPLVKAGKLRLLAVADAQRTPALPDVPTLDEAGGPKGLHAQAWVALMAPRGTPAPVAAEINKAVNEALQQPDVKEKMAAFGFAPGTQTPQQLADLARDDRARYAEVVKRLKISID
jgi:tripartite-type tricarboxylate transporter receptor subunit TctC